MSLTALQVTQLNNMNAAAQRAQLGTLLSYGDPAGTVYFVDNNAGADTNNGLSWGSAYKTLAVALAASHANIAASSSGWAARNRIYYKADAETVTLTKGAQKTDVIGVGSYDHRPRAGIIGNHVLDSTSYMGMRWFNIHFKSPAGGGTIMTVPTQQSGIEFIDCMFDGNSTTPAVRAILATTTESLAVRYCTFQGAFSDAVIEIAGTENNGLMIVGNIIQGGQQGIDVKSTVTTSIRSGYILDNTINSVTECINEASGKIYVHGNRCVTLAAKGAAGAGAIVAGAKMMLDNRISASDVANANVPALGTL